MDGSEMVPLLSWNQTANGHNMNCNEKRTLKIPVLSREELVSVIEGCSKAHRVPMQIHLWIHPDSFGDREQAVREIMEQYPADIQIIGFRMPDIFRSQEYSDGYSWVPYQDPYQGQNIARDARIAIADWSQLDEVLKYFPNPDYDGLFQNIPADDGRYRLGHWWYCLFERHWSLRGMTNALTDYYDNPREVHRLFRSITDFYLAIMERGRTENQFDGIFTSDDLGTQTQPFFSLKIFREFYLPYYKELIEKAHALGMHFWLHACGNVEAFIPDWIEIGLDVLHPIQKYAMNEKEVADKFGKHITILAGLDVQQVIPWGSPREVRAEVRHLMNTYWRPGEGKLILSAGNGINEDCPLESLEAFFDEAVRYGKELVEHNA